MKEENSTLINVKKTNKSSNNLLNGIIWHIDNKIVIPQLMLPKKIF